MGNSSRTGVEISLINCGYVRVWKNKIFIREKECKQRVIIASNSDAIITITIKITELSIVVCVIPFAMIL